MLHRGQVYLSGSASLGEESLSGPEVNFVFRMEKLAGTMGEGCLVSEVAAQGLNGILASQPVGEHALAGFEGRFQLFTV